MDIKVLRLTRYCIRYWEKSRKLSVLGKSRERKYYTKGVNPFRLVANIPLFVSSNKRLFLEGMMSFSSDSKNDNVYNEMRNDRGDESRIFCSRWNEPFSRLVKVFRVLLRLPRLIFFFFYIKYRAPVSSGEKDFVAVLIAYDAFKRFFRHHSRMAPLIISDVNPLRCIIGAAGAAVNNMGVWYQEDYHHSYNEMIPIKAAVVMTSDEVRNIRSVSSEIKIYARSNNRIQRVRDDLRVRRVGLAVNAIFDMNVLTDGYLKKLVTFIGVSKFYVRLHPRNYDKVNREISNISGVYEIAPRGEKMKEYLEKVDVVVVGNSAFALHALVFGVPVIHTSGLDPMGYDLYGYVNNGVIYGERNIDKDVIKRMNKFYKNNDYYERLKLLIRPASDVAKAASLLCEL